MPLPDWKRYYPFLHKLFGAYEGILQPSHPLGYLVSIDQENVRRAAAKTEASCRCLGSANPKWLKSKSRIVTRKSLVEASATLAEIRAHGDLLTAWRHEQVRPPQRGVDFIVHIGSERVWVEVHTPQGRSDWAKVSRPISTTADGKIGASISEFAPFGLPDPSIPSTQGKCAFWISRIKRGKRHQFSEEEISVLWLDFNDPGVWPIPLDSDQALPIISWREYLTSGCFWSALYAEEGDAVFDNLNVEGMSGRPYRMTFPGRFTSDSKIDFVIIDTVGAKIVFQNHKGIKPVPEQLFRDLFSLPGFDLSLSWLDWPIHGSLGERVAHARQEIEVFTTAFKVW